MGAQMGYLRRTVLEILAEGPLPMSHILDRVRKRGYRCEKTLMSTTLTNMIRTRQIVKCGTVDGLAGFEDAWKGSALYAITGSAVELTPAPPTPRQKRVRNLAPKPYATGFRWWAGQPW